MNRESKRYLKLIDLAISYSVRADRIRTDRVQDHAHPKVKVSAGFTKSKKTGKITELFVMVPCSCFPCESYRKSIAICKLHTGKYEPTFNAVLKDGSILTKAMVLPEPLPEPKYFKNKSLPEHVHVRRRLHQTLSRYLPHG